MSSVLQGAISSLSVAFWLPDLRCESKVLFPSHLLRLVFFNMVTIHAAEIVIKMCPCLIKWYYCAFSLYADSPQFLEVLVEDPFPSFMTF